MLEYTLPKGSTAIFKTSPANGTCSLMDSPSQWEWYWKLFALVLFALAVGAVWWIAHKAAFEWIPESAIGYVFVAMMCLAAGILIGQWSVTRKLRRESAPDRR